MGRGFRTDTTGTRRARSPVPRRRSRVTDGSCPRRDAATRSHGVTDLVRLAAWSRGGRRSPDGTPSPGGGAGDSQVAAVSSPRPGCVRTRAATRACRARPRRVRAQCHPRLRPRCVVVRDVSVTMSENRTLAVRIPDAMAMRVTAPAHMARASRPPKACSLARAAPSPQDAFRRRSSARPQGSLRRL